MKKITSILLTLCMLLCLLPMAVQAQSANTTNLLTEEKLTKKVNDGNWTFEGSELKASNKNFNDSAYLTDYKIEKGSHVYVEATAKYDGLAWGIMFTENPDNPFGNWFCLNIDGDRYDSRMFFIGTAANSGTPYQPEISMPNARDGAYHTLGLEILADGSMKLYLDGELHTELKDAKFEGATVGLMTCRADATFKSFTMQNGAPTHTKVMDRTPRDLEYTSTTNLLSSDVLKYAAGNSQFTIADGKMSANRGGGDSAILSDIQVKPGDHVYIEATGKVTDGNAWGIILAADKNNPFANWICLNVSVDVYKSRIFAPGSDCDVASPYEYFYFDTSNARNEEITLGLEITADGTFYLTCNGVTFAEKKTETWNGAYLGLMTWESAVEFTSASYNVVKGLKEEAPPTVTPTTPPTEKPTTPPVTGDSLTVVVLIAVVSVCGAVLTVKKRKSI